jgi:HK97 family phage prohead protease
MTVLTRAFATKLELRDGGDGRTLYGRAVPYGEEAQIGSYTEVFVRGAFADAGTHVLTAMHPRHGGELPIGRSVEARDAPDGLWGVWRVSETELGNDVLALARDGVPLSLSVGFIEGRNRWNATHTRVERLTAVLDHVAVVREGAYAGAGVTGLRSADVDQGRPRLSLARRWT